MKKIPSLFIREFEDHKVCNITEEVYPGMQWVLKGEGIATLKLDGSCTGYFNGKFYKRYDAKNGKNPPLDAIPIGTADPITGHWPHWLEVKESKPEDKWYLEAYKNYLGLIEREPEEGTYEALGPHFQGNPYAFDYDILIPHGSIEIPELNYKERSFEQIKEYLKSHDIEGIVFWKDGEPQCKIKRSDFGFSWK